MRWSATTGGREVAAQIEAQIDELRAMLTALAILREASPRSLDGIAAAGELLSSRLVAAAFRRPASRPPGSMRGARIVTDDHYTAAVPDIDGTHAALAREVVPHLTAGRIPVLGGYRRRHAQTASRRRSGAAGRTIRPRSSARRSAPPRFRSGPTSTAC